MFRVLWKKIIKCGNTIMMNYWFYVPSKKKVASEEEKKKIKVAVADKFGI